MTTQIKLILLCALILSGALIFWGYQIRRNSDLKSENKLLIEQYQTSLQKNRNLEKMKEREARLYLKEISRKDSVIAKISKKEAVVAVRLENLKPVKHTVTELEIIWKKRYNY